MAEHILRSLLAQRHIPWDVESAGLHAVDGRPIARAAAQALADRRIVVEGRGAHRVTRRLICRADLVLVAQLDHRSAVVLLEPPALIRTFTILQFARFAHEASRVEPDLSTGGELLEAALRARGRLQPPAAGADDLADPSGRSLAEYRACANTLDRALGAIVGAIATPAA